MRDQILKILKNPITGLVVGACVAIVLFFAGQKEVQPQYATSEPELLAEITAQTPRLKLLWDGTEIPNIYSQKIVIWNDGRSYLDNSNISNTDPIKVLAPDGIKLLFYKFTNTSRKDLSFNIRKENENNLIVVINGDEALEYKDGGLLSVLYTGDTTEGFEVAARIKGVPKGFEKTKWNNVAQKDYGYKDWIPIAVFVLNVLFIAILLLFKFKRGVIKISDLLPLVFMIIASLYMLYDKLKPILFGVSWAY